MIGTSDQSFCLAEAGNILLLPSNSQRESMHD